MTAGFLDRLPLNYKHLRRGFGTVDVPAGVVRRGRELYYGLTEWVDEQIGMMLEALRKSPFADNTVVVYTCDHGENMGEHGLWWKNCVYGQAAHIPMIVSWPERWRRAQRRAGACSNVDLVRTLAEIGGARTPPDWDGASVVRWLDDAGSRWKDMAVSQYYAHNIASGYAMIRSGEWKYVYHSAPDKDHPAERGLYNLTDDPKELRNLSADATQKHRLDNSTRRWSKNSASIRTVRRSASGWTAARATAPHRDSSVTPLECVRSRRTARQTCGS